MIEYVKFWLAQAAVELGCVAAVFVLVLVFAAIDAFVIQPRRRKAKMDRGRS